MLAGLEHIFCKPELLVFGTTLPWCIVSMGMYIMQVARLRQCCLRSAALCLLLQDELLKDSLSSKAKVSVYDTVINWTNHLHEHAGCSKSMQFDF